MQSKRFGQRFFKSGKAAVFVIFTVVTLNSCPAASGIQFRGLLTEILPSHPAATDPSDIPAARTEAILSPSTMPMKSLWLAAAMGLIYCLRRPKRA